MLPTWLLIVSGLAMVGLATFALTLAEWRALLAVPIRQHVLFGSTLALLGIWLLSVPLGEGLWLHLSLFPALTLLVGARLAGISGLAVVIPHTLILGESLLAVPTAWLISVAVPVAVTRLLVHLLRRTDIRNLFLFMLGAGFAGSLLSVLIAAVAVLAILWLAGASAEISSALQYWALIFPICFQEGFINGLIVTALTVFWPGIVKTFDERFYLDEEDD